MSGFLGLLAIVSFLVALLAGPVTKYLERGLVPGERRPLTCRQAQAQIQRHALARQVEVAREQVRLRAETTRCIRELELEMLQELERRQRRNGR